MVNTHIGVHRTASRKRRVAFILYLQGNDNYSKPRLAYASKVWWMTDAQLLHETEQAIWLSAYAANNRRSDYHWWVDVCYAECERRNNVALYEKAYKQASAGCR